MHLRKRRCLLTVPVFLCSMLFCSGFDDSTDLGAGVIESIYPGQVTIGKHLRRYSMNTSECDSAFSLPGASDSGFVVHAATASYMTIGTKSDSLSTERAAGYVRFVCPPDTGSSRAFSVNDTLRKITVRFFRDITIDKDTQPCRIAVWSSDSLSRALNPDTALGDIIHDTVQFVKASQDSNNHATIPDSIELLPDTLTRAIFAACTTSSKNTSALFFGFILTNLDSGVIRFRENAEFTIQYTRSSDTGTVKTAGRIRTYGSAYSSYYLATDGNPDSVQRIPVLSYPVKRTAVFRYDATALWDTVDALINQQHAKTAQIVSAVFSLKGPATGDTLNLRYLLLDSLERNVDVLDTLFAFAPADQSAATVRNTSQVLANVLPLLQNFTQNGRPSTLFLYLRFNGDSSQKWKKTRWQNVPLLSAMIAVP
jgi:hypothetical protein